MSVAELIGKEKILINYWLNPYMEKLRRLLFVTETDYVDSILNYPSLLDKSKSLKYFVF